MLVWILEEWEETEKYQKYLDEIKESLKVETDQERIDAHEELVKLYEKIISENPNGMWTGKEGKVIYRQFCDAARGFMLRHPDAKVRVIRGEIPDGSQYWMRYKFVEENTKVLHYLKSTI